MLYRLKNIPLLQYGFLLLLLSGPFTALSQTREYFNHVYKAESLIMEAEYAGALGEYITAFDFNGAPYLKDLHNALLCSRISDKKDSQRLLVEILATYCLDPKYIEHSVVGQLLKQDSSLNFAEEPDATLRNCPNAEFFTKLQTIDQSVRQACKSLSGNYYALCGEEIRQLDSLNLDNLKQFFNNHSIPGNTEDINGHPSKPPSYFLTVKHNLQWGRTQVIPDLLKAVTENKFHPQLYADLIDYYNPSFLKIAAVYGTNMHCALRNRMFLFQADENDEGKINKMREELFLEPIHIYNQKLAFQFFHPEFYFVYPATIFRFDTNEQEEKMLAEKWKALEAFDVWTVPGQK